MIKVIHCKVEDFSKMMVESIKLEEQLRRLSLVDMNIARQKKTIKEIVSDPMVLKSSREVLEDLEKRRKKSFADYQQKQDEWNAKWTRFGVVEDYENHKEVD